TLMRSIQHPVDPDLWDFISTRFFHDDLEWEVYFGTFFPGVKDPREALRLGQDYFKSKAEIIIEGPEPEQIPGMILCEYTPTGREYWIAANTPPSGKNN